MKGSVFQVARFIACRRAMTWNRVFHHSRPHNSRISSGWKTAFISPMLTHPDHDTIANFRGRFLEQLKPLFLQILLLAKVMGFLQLGKISLDGSKVQANASKHSA
jgi:transposase